MGGRGSGRSVSFGLLVTKCQDLHSIDLACASGNQAGRPYYGGG